MTVENLNARAERFDTARVVAVSFEVLLRNFVPFICIAGLIAIPSLLVQYWERVSPAEPTITINGQSLLSVVVEMLTTALTQCALTYGTLQDLRGRRAGLAECFTRGFSAAPKVVIAAILWTIAIWIGLLLLVVPGVILMLMFWVYVPAIVVENAGVTESFARSRTLTRGHRWSIFWLFVLLSFLLFGLEMLVTGFVGFDQLALALTTGWLFWLFTAFGVVVTAYVAVVTSVGYYHLRAEKEGVIIDDIAKVFD